MAHKDVVLVDLYVSGSKLVILEGLSRLMKSEPERFNRDSFVEKVYLIGFSRKGIGAFRKLILGFDLLEMVKSDLFSRPFLTQEDLQANAEIN